MLPAPDPTRPLVRLNPARLILVGLVLALALGAVALPYHLAERAGTRTLTDFDIFHLAGGMAWDGTLAEAYDAHRFQALQSEISGRRGNMLWMYPPQFGLLGAALALLPVWLAFLAFTGGTLAAYVLVLRRLAGEQFGIVLLAMLPTLLIGIAMGQNGFLTGTLLGLFLLLAPEGRRAAGVPLGLMVLKPHLALGLGAWLLFAGRWRWLLQAAATVAATALLATVTLGPGIWPAFLAGAAQAKALLGEGGYSLHRMTSAFALLRSLGVGSGVALALHAVVALGALAAIHLALRQGWEPRRSLAAATVASLLASPYLYEYDMTVLGLALALAARDLAAPGVRRLAPLVVGLAWFVSLYAYGSGWLTYQRYLAGAELGLEDRPVALSAAAVLVLAALLLAVLRRAERSAVGAPVPA